MKNNCIASETFGTPGCNYFLDFKQAANQRDYIQITRSDRQGDGRYKRSTVTIFEDHFYFLVESLSMLFSAAAHQKQFGSSMKKDAEKQLRGIKGWPEEQRPREKLLAQGAGRVSDAELLAILIGSGTAEQNAVALAGSVLEGVGDNLSLLARLSARQLCSFRGIGPAKALTIIAAMELGNRRYS